MTKRASASGGTRPVASSSSSSRKRSAATRAAAVGGAPPQVVAALDVAGGDEDPPQQQPMQPMQPPKSQQYARTTVAAYDAAHRGMVPSYCSASDDDNVVLKLNVVDTGDSQVPGPYDEQRDDTFQPKPYPVRHDEDDVDAGASALHPMHPMHSPTMLLDDGRGGGLVDGGGGGACVTAPYTLGGMGMPLPFDRGYDDPPAHAPAHAHASSSMQYLPNSSPLPLPMPPPHLHHHHLLQQPPPHVHVHAHAHAHGGVEGDLGVYHPHPLHSHHPHPSPAAHSMQSMHAAVAGCGVVPPPPSHSHPSSATHAPRSLRIIRLLTEFEEKSKQGEWPSSTSVHCYWCAHRFPNAPFGLPVKHTAGVFHVVGCFCSVECAAAYNFASTRDGIDVCLNRYALLNMMAARLGAGQRVRPAPDRLTLTMFGGHLSIEEFRAMGAAGTCQILVNAPPMLAVTQQLEEVYEADMRSEYKYIPLDADRVSRFQEKLRLRRMKPIINFRNTLDHTMKLKYNTRPTPDPVAAVR